MKIWQLALACLAIAVLGGSGWYFSSSDGKKPADRETKTYRSRKIATVARKSSRTESRISERKRLREQVADKKGAASDPNWDPFNDGKGFKMEDFDFDLGGDLIKEMSSSVLSVLADMRKAQSHFDKKATLASVQKLLAMIARGEKVSTFAKLQAVDALKFCGGGVANVLPEIVQMAADPDPQVSEASISALQELLWDWDTTPRQICDAIKTLLPLTSDANLISPFIFEMSEMPTSIKVETTLAIMDSGNKGAFDALSDNMGFVYDDFNGAIQTREDVVNYGKTHADE